MKKIITMIVMTALMVSVLSGCGNMSPGFGNFQFSNIHFQIHDKCADAYVEKWYDYAEGVEVLTREYGSLFLSEGTYIMYNGVCPLCEGAQNGWR